MKFWTKVKQNLHWYFHLIEHNIDESSVGSPKVENLQLIETNHLSINFNLFKSFDKFNILT